jgi:hypothetical protein
VGGEESQLDAQYRTAEETVPATEEAAAAAAAAATAAAAAATAASTSWQTPLEALEAAESAAAAAADAADAAAAASAAADAAAVAAADGTAPVCAAAPPLTAWEEWEDSTKTEDSAFYVEPLPALKPAGPSMEIAEIPPYVPKEEDHAVSTAW